MEDLPSLLFDVFLILKQTYNEYNKKRKGETYV